MKLGKEAERNLKDRNYPMVISMPWGHKSTMPTHQEPSYVRLEIVRVSKDTRLPKQDKPQLRYCRLH